MAQNPKIAVRGAGLGENAAACEAIGAKQGSCLKAFRPHLGEVFLKEEVGATAIGFNRRDVAGACPELIGDSSVIYNCDVIDAKLIPSFHAADGIGADAEAMAVCDTRHATSIAFAGLNPIQAGFTGFRPAAMAHKALGVRPGTAFS